MLARQYDLSHLLCETVDLPSSGARPSIVHEYVGHQPRELPVPPGVPAPPPNWHPECGVLFVCIAYAFIVWVEPLDIDEAEPHDVLRTTVKQRERHRLDFAPARIHNQTLAEFT